MRIALRLCVAVLSLALGACASLSGAQRDQVTAKVVQARSTQVDCTRPDACAQRSPLRALAGRAFAESTPDAPAHYALILDRGPDALLARGPSFFDAQRYPTIEFVSEPHPDTLIHTGGRMRGRLSMHGVTRMETFTISRADCDQPGKDCDVLANGSISREDNGLDGWQFALVDRVRFMLRVRLVEAPL